MCQTGVSRETSHHCDPKDVSPSSLPPVRLSKNVLLPLVVVDPPYPILSGCTSDPSFPDDSSVSTTTNPVPPKEESLTIPPRVVTGGEERSGRLSPLSTSSSPLSLSVQTPHQHKRIETKTEREGRGPKGETDEDREGPQRPPPFRVRKRFDYWTETRFECPPTWSCV